MKRTGSVLTALLLAFGLLVAPSSASAAPRDIDNSSLESVRDAYLTWLQPALDAQWSWNGDIGKCVSGSPAKQPEAAAGTMSSAGRSATLEAINYFRVMAGLQPVTEHLAGSELAQQAALIMKANNTLTHSPTPEMACFSLEGARGATSNLSIGTAGARAIRSFIDDYGDANTSVGHRRWLLNPPLSAVGIGSTSSTTATYVFGDDGSTWANARPTGGTAWPSAGYVPWEVMPTSGRWSYSAPGVDFTSATVTMRKNGAPWTVQPITRNGPYGDPTIVWSGGSMVPPTVDDVDTYDVTIGGLAGGPITYQVKTFRAAVARVGSVTVAGDPSVGSTLAATAHDTSPTSTEVYVSYAWYADGVQVSDESFYLVTPEDVGKQLVAKATASTLGVWASTTTSSNALEIMPGVLEPDGVGINGSPTVGEPLGFVEGSWVSPGRVASPTFALQWLRDGAVIAGANGYGYRPTTADLGRRIALRVTGSAPGFLSATVTTGSVGPVIERPAPLRTFTRVPTPTISGTAQVGRTLTAKPGSWSPTPSGYRYQWYRSGRAIAGANGSTHVLAPATKDGTITVRVTGSRAGYVTTTSKPSGATKKVKAGTITAVKPKITGTVRVGSTLKAVPGRWKPSTTTFSYQWYRNSSKIKKATRASYLLRSSDKGKKISVKVTGRATGYTTKAVTSSRTAKVRARA